MNGRIRVGLYAMIIVLLALVSAFSAVPARADDGAPPPPAAPATDVAPAQASSPDSSPASLNEAAPTDSAPANVAPADAAPTDVAPTDAAPTDAAPTEAAPTDAASSDVAPAAPATDAAPTDPAPTADTPADLSQVPAGTDVVVVNAAGDSVPLASQAASDIIATGDPIWCPSGAAPNPGAGGCTASYSNLSSLIAAFTSNSISDPAANGVIWITGYVTNGNAADSSGSTITIDGTDVNLGSWKNYTLTVNGGWTGTTAGTMNTSDPSIFNVPLSITNWNNDVTLNNIVIQNVSGSSNTALQVKTTKKISLTHVVVGDPLNVNVNAGPGAVLDNSLGTSDVNVTSSKFDYNNNGIGLSVISNGTITLNDVLADHNSGDGANLNNSGGAAKNVILAGGTLDFSHNGGNGLFIQSKGQITLTSVTASFNTSDGASLDNSTAASAMTVSLAGTNVFSSNGGTAGLAVLSKGPITINALTASSNSSGYGAQINNTYLGPTSPQAVTFTGANVFSSNHNDGLNILTNGVVTLNSITANSNGNGVVGYGVYVDNHTNITQLPGVTVSSNNGNNQFNLNQLTGLKILTNGAILLSNVTASNNANGYGVYLDNCNLSGTCANLTAETVTLTGTNVMSGNHITGLWVNSKGIITINSLTASSNSTGYGAHLDNHFLGINSPQAVTLTGTNVFSSNQNDGLSILTFGAITLNSITSNYSASGNGLNVDNRGNISQLPGVTITGTNSFSNNWLTGLEILTNGAISLNSVAANGNGALGHPGYGIYLDNCNFVSACANLTVKTITLTGTNAASNNYLTGLLVNSKGVISISSLTASSNSTGYGAKLDDTLLGPASPQDVTITGVNQFNTNYYDGLNVSTYGAISLSSVTANGNGALTHPGYGIYLDNCKQVSGHCANITVKNVTLTGTNSASNNYLTGLWVSSKGVITISSLTASTNSTGYGALLNNTYLGITLPQAVTITGTNVLSTNGNDGLNILTYGAVTLNSITANGNGTGHDDPTDTDSLGYGLYVKNVLNLTLLPNVTITGTNSFSNNWLSGLVIFTNGVISVSNVTASSNGGGHYIDFGYGAYLNNCSLTNGGSCTNPTVKTITLTGINAASNNYNTGLFVNSKGTITISNLTASSNANGYGAQLYNTLLSPASPQDVTINGVNAFSSNYFDGLNVLTYGAISLSNVTASDNGLTLISDTTYGYGVYLENCISNGTVCANVTTKPVTLTGTNNISGNYNTGLFVNSKGVITINGLTADTNGQSGATGYGYGAQLDNHFLGTTMPQVVTITGSNFNGNYDDGLNVFTNGMVTLNTLVANNNGNGVTDTGTGYGVFVDNHSNVTLMPDVNVTGVNQFNDNWLTGLEIFTNGMINLNSVTADGNGTSTISGYGVYLDNCNVSSGHCINNTAKAITLTGTNSASGNYITGLLVNSKGAITVNGLTANDNGNYGVDLNNKFSGIIQTVTVNGGTFTGNPTDGLVNGVSVNGINIQSNGVVKLNSVPMWCPAGVAPGGAGCSIAYPTLQDLIAAIGPSFHPAANGVIWIQNTMFDSLGTGIVFDGTLSSYWTTWSNYSLTLQGGWSGPGSTISTTPTTLQDALSIIHWNAPVTLSDIEITGVTGSGSTALTITTSKNIILTRVNVHDNDGAGANLDNCLFDGGTHKCIGTGSVAVNYSAFNGNSGDGLKVLSNGAITGANITAVDNAGTGAILNNCNTDGTHCTTPASQPVTLTSINNFNSNTSDGLDVYSKGSITINNLYANTNGNQGVYLDNCNGDVPCDNNSGAYNVTLNGSNTATYNYSSGLTIFATGAITISNLTASYNGTSGAGYGAYLDNFGAHTTGRTISLTGTNFFTGNGSTGLWLNSQGAVSASNLYANTNGNGLLVSCNPGDTCDGLHIKNSAAFTITGFGTFNGNKEDGLEAYSLGAITLTSITATDNGLTLTPTDYGLGFGVYLDNCSIVSNSCTLPGANNVTLGGFNIANGNYGSGLTVWTTGSISVSYLTANDNGTSGIGYGAHLDNFGTHTTGRTISLTGINTFTGNSSTGLWMDGSKGAVSVSNLTTIKNGFNDPCSLSDSCDGFYTAHSSGVTISGFGIFNKNNNDGLLVYTVGAITLSNITATYNGNQGVYLDNCSGPIPCGNPGAYNVTLSGTNIASDNVASGLTIWATGSISVSNLTANNNGTSGTDEYGAYLDNFGTTSLQKPIINISGTNTLMWNGSTGLWMDSKGAVSVSNVTASYNGADVACVPTSGNCAGLYVGDSAGLTLSGYGIFNENDDNGLYVSSLGSMTLTNLYAYKNGGWGAYLDNCQASGTFPNLVCTGNGNLTLNGTNVFTHNGSTGLSAISSGIETLSNITASYNGTMHGLAGSGAYVVNCLYNTVSPQCENVSVPHAVTLNGINNFNDNYIDGLAVYTLGAITAGQVTASNNATGHGALLDNQWSYQNYNITLTGNNMFNGNGEAGLEAYSNGSITMSNLTANDNTGGTSIQPVSNGETDAGGVYLSAVSQTTSPVAISLTGFNTFNGNGNSGSGAGLYIYGDGAITISNLAANNNQGYGALLDNATQAPPNHLLVPSSITLTGFGNFVGNGNDGLVFNSSGAFNATQQVTSGKNAGNGVRGAATGSITLTCGNLYLNVLRGLDLTSATAITLKGVTSGQNGGADIFSLPPVIQACPLP